MDPSSSEQLAAVPPDTTEEEKEHIIGATKTLRCRMGLPEDPTEKSSAAPPPGMPVFWVELSPPSNRGAACRLYCGKSIMPGKYRIAVSPGDYSVGKNCPDYYHIECFEKIADFSQADFLDQVLPLTRNVWRFRNLNSSSVLDGNYLLDAGAERLTHMWKLTVGKQIDERDVVESKDDSNAAFTDLLHKAGSSKYVPQEIPDVDSYEYDLLMTTLAPIESDGPEDTEEWNLFDEYLVVQDDDQTDLNNRHSLSQTLSRWELHVVLATSNNLSDKGKEWREEELTPKAIRAIERLSDIPMPDIQSAFW